MHIVGLQKMTLLDFPGKVACTVFLGGCNFRCPFCHNSQLLGADAQPYMTQAELLAFLQKRKGLLDGVCITGGEPTLYHGLPELLAIGAVAVLHFAKHNTLLSMIRMSEQTFRVMEKVVLPAPNRGFTVTYDFYKELKDNMVLTTHPIPMLILHGEEDAYISMADIQNFHRINEKSQLVIIPGTSHRFLEEGAWDMVLDLTRDWFDFEQVLLM